jgi:hypothetical protein
MAFAVANGDALLTLNPDTEVRAGTLSGALAALRAEPRRGALGIRQIGLDGQTQRSVRGFPTFWNLLGETTGLASLLPASPFASYRLQTFDYERPGPAPQPMGTFLLLRREALAQVGDPRAPFDEAFPIFFNEVDLLYRLHRAGWSCHYEPSVTILHHGGESTKQVRQSMIWESHRSLMRYLAKHTRGPARLGLPLLNGAIWMGALIRARGVHEGFRA